MAYFGNIEKATLNNTKFRQVMYTGPKEQLVVMHLKPGEEIGSEIHKHAEQFFRIEEGRATFVVAGRKTRTMGPGSVIVVPPGTRHNVINQSKTKPVKLYTLYAPPVH